MGEEMYNRPSDGEGAAARAQSVVSMSLPPRPKSPAVFDRAQSQTLGAISEERQYALILTRPTLSSHVPNPSRPPVRS